MNRVRVAILGLGAVAQAVHLPLLDRLQDRFEIVGVADLSASLATTIGERYLVPPAHRGTTLAGLLDIDGLDALMILTSGSHGEAVLAGLDRDLTVFVEKPLAWTLGEADAVAARLAADPRRRLQVGYMKLYDPAVVAALAVTQDLERAGAIRSIEVCVLHPTGEQQLAHARVLAPPVDLPVELVAQLRDRGERLRATALGPAAPGLGPLYTDVILGSIVHELALIRAFAGDPAGIDAVDVWPPDRWPPSVGVSGQLGDRGRFAIRWHYLPDHPAYREDVRVVTDRAAVELEFPSPYLLNAPTHLRVSERSGGSSRETILRSVTEAFETQLLAFHDLVANRVPPRAGVVEGRADIATGQQIVAHLAARTGIPVRIEAQA